MSYWNETTLGFNCILEREEREEEEEEENMSTNVTSQTVNDTTTPETTSQAKCDSASISNGSSDTFSTIESDKSELLGDFFIKSGEEEEEEGRRYQQVKQQYLEKK